MRVAVCSLFIHLEICNLVMTAGASYEAIVASQGFHAHRYAYQPQGLFLP